MTLNIDFAMIITMNCIIFAGGIGSRLWPLSRRATPKQFEPFFEGRSTLQLAIDRIREFGIENVFVSTNANYVSIIKKQIPDLQADNIYSEPAKRDLAAAVCLTLMRLKAQGVTGPVSVLWADHVMQSPDSFRDALRRGEEYVTKNPNKIVFLGEKNRFANHNLGWINVGDSLADGFRSFKGWKYRPDVDACNKMHAGGDWLWNPGYFIFDIEFMLSLFSEHQATMYSAIKDMVESSDKIEIEYEKVESINFDKAILEKLGSDQAVVLPVDLGWSDPGTLYAMKELLAESEEDNVEIGNVITHSTRDSLVYNTVDHQLVTTIGMDGAIVVNTKDSILVCGKNTDHKDVRLLLEEIESKGLKENL
jgi:mannose-1-phosphate guanylyltransferase